VSVAKDAIPDLLQKRWLHSHEEDSDTGMVFRPASFKFPPSRGRAGFDLKANNKFIEIGIAAADGPQESAGTWKLFDNKLELYKPSSSKPARTLQIVSADKDRLVVRKD
jgi:hypothetical protein